MSTGQVRPAEAVGVWGVGGLGAHGVQLLRMVGAAPIVAVDILPEARERALAFGADVALDPRADDFAAAMAAATGGRGLDVAFDFAGVDVVRAQALSCLGLQGRLVLVGLSGNPISISDSTAFSYTRKQVRGHYGSEAHHVPELVALSTESGSPQGEAKYTALTLVRFTLGSVSTEQTREAMGLDTSSSEAEFTAGLELLLS